MDKHLIEKLCPNKVFQSHCPLVIVPLLLQIPFYPPSSQSYELLSLGFSSYLRLREHENRNRLQLFFLRSGQQRRPAEGLLNLANGSHRNKKRKLRIKIFDYVIITSSSFFSQTHTHPPPTFFLLEGATCHRLKRQHSDVNCLYKASKLDFRNLKVSEESYILRPKGHVLESKQKANESSS